MNKNERLIHSTTRVNLKASMLHEGQVRKSMHRLIGLHTN